MPAMLLLAATDTTAKIEPLVPVLIAALVYAALWCLVAGAVFFARRPVEPVEVFPIDPELQRSQAERVRTLKAQRPDQDGVRAALADVEAAARGTQNLLVPMKEALRRKATLGEVSDVLRGVFGVYQPSR